MSVPLETRRFHAATHDGWRLSLKRVFSKDHVERRYRPLVLIPGYGMNSFILGYHPTGISMEAYFARRGYEVWSVDLRGQGDSNSFSGKRNYEMADLALTDLTVCFDFIAEHTQSDRDGLNAIGCSLGGSLVFIHLACQASHHVRACAALGAPLRWEKVHPLLALAFRSEWLAGLFPHRGNRRLASVLFPLALKVPRSLHLYMHPEISDTSDHTTLLRTVDDTSRALNRQMARWIKEKELHLAGRNISHELNELDLPFLCVIANADGVVPAETALSAYEEWGGDDKSVLVVGDSSRRFAHADLFISDFSEELVFAPIADWFVAREPDGT
jgi:pimeloyl-ACP methyl ester carboxylesterase